MMVRVMVLLLVLQEIEVPAFRVHSESIFEIVGL